MVNLWNNPKKEQNSCPPCHHACRLYLAGEVLVHLLTLPLPRRCLDREHGWEVGWIWVSWCLTNKLLQLLKSSCRWASLEQAISSRGMLPVNFGIYASCLPFEKSVFAYNVLLSTSEEYLLCFLFSQFWVSVKSCAVRTISNGLWSLELPWPLLASEP